MHDDLRRYTVAKSDVRAYEIADGGGGGGGGIRLPNGSR